MNVERDNLDLHRALAEACLRLHRAGIDDADLRAVLASTGYKKNAPAERGSRPGQEQIINRTSGEVIDLQ